MNIKLAAHFLSQTQQNMFSKYTEKIIEKLTKIHKPTFPFYFHTLFRLCTLIKYLAIVIVPLVPVTQGRTFNHLSFLLQILYVHR